MKANVLFTHIEWAAGTIAVVADQVTDSGVQLVKKLRTVVRMSDAPSGLTIDGFRAWVQSQVDSQIVGVPEATPDDVTSKLHMGRDLAAQIEAQHAQIEELKARESGLVDAARAEQAAAEQATEAAKAENARVELECAKVNAMCSAKMAELAELDARIASAKAELAP